MDHFPPTSHDNRLFRILVLSAFLGLHRLGELVWPDDTDLQSWRKVIRRASVSHSTTSYAYTLPGHKADRIFAGSQVLIHDEHAPPGLAPAAEFRRYLDGRDTLFPLHPALWLTSSGNIPTKSWFLSRLRACLPDETISGHSFRAGGATYFASIGWPDDHIQALGRWSSEAFRIYIRKTPAVLQALLHARRPDPIQ